MLDAGLGRQKGTVEVDCQHPLPLGKGKLIDGMHDLYASIRNKDVETANRGDRVTNAGIDLVLIGYVHADGHRRFAAGQGTRGRARGFEVEVGYDDPTLRFEVAFGDRVADATGCACDEGNFSVEVHGGS